MWALMWEEKTLDNCNVICTWDEALEHVESLNAERYMGFDGWYLPSIKELLSLVNYDTCPVVDHKLHPYVGTVNCRRYWTSTRFVNMEESPNRYVWAVNLLFGTTDIRAEDGKNCGVLAVR